MKKWHKWTLGIVGLLLVAIVIVVVLMWSTLSILKGTEGLSGKTETIPKTAADELPPLTSGESDWICWLGATGDNRSAVTGIIKDWSKRLQKRWEINYLCQEGETAVWSAPVIQGNRLVVCGRDSMNDLTFCLNAQTGRLLWHTSYKAKTISNHGSGPRATPYIDENRVYTFGRAGDLVCWNLFDGQQLWKVNVNDLGGEAPTWGHASSPLVIDDKVIVQGGGTIRTVAFKKNSGEIAWTSGSGTGGYAAIRMMSIEGTPAILAFHSKGLAALELNDGRELWNVPWVTDYDVNATTPQPFGDKVVITSGYKVGCALLKVSRQKVNILWKNQNLAAQHTDPYLINGYLYGYSGDSYQNRGAFKCLNLETGDELWSTNDMGWGTCTYVDEHLICCDIKGNLFLMKPDPKKFIKVTALPRALGDVSGPVWTKPIIANGLMYVRFKQRLVCYNLVEK